jgi:hypothetical protein
VASLDVFAVYPEGGVAADWCISDGRQYGQMVCMLQPQTTARPLPPWIGRRRTQGRWANKIMRRVVIVAVTRRRNGWPSIYRSLALSHRHNYC